MKLILLEDQEWKVKEEEIQKYREQCQNYQITSMVFESQTIKIIMAANRIDMLDAALLRSGRIDRKIRILKIHTKKMNLMREIYLRKIVEVIPSASGAESKAVCTEAGIFALRERRIHVTQEDFEMSVEKNMAINKMLK